MKKRINYLLIIFFLAFAWIGTAKAAKIFAGVTQSHTFSALGDENYYRVKRKYVPELYCPTQTPKGYGDVVVIDEVNSNGNKTGYVIIKTVYVNENMEKDGNGNYTTAEDSFDCSFKIEGSNEAATYSGTDIGKISFKYKFEPLKEEQSGVITLRGRLTEGMIDSNSLLHRRFYMDEIVSSQITSGAELINLNCPAGAVECIVTGNETGGIEKTATAVIKYKKKTHPDKEYTLNLKILVNYTGAARAYPGKDYVCSFNSDWQPFSKENADTGESVKYYTALKNNIEFPTCTVKEGYQGIKLNFAGWSTNPSMASGQKLNRCKNDANSRVIPAGVNYVGDKTQNWYSCFEFEDFVGLRTSLGTLLGDGWSKYEGVGMDYIKYAHGEVTLPGVEFTDKYSFGGWTCTGYTGLKQAGDTVRSGTTCSAVKNNEYSYISLDKTVYVGKTLTIAVSDRKITSCSVTSGSNVSVEAKDGTCIVTGLSETSTPNDVKVVFEKVSGKDDDRTYKITVQRLEDIELDYIIAAPVSGAPSYGDGGGGIIFSGSSCGSFIAGNEKSHNTIEGVEESVYSVESQCGDNAKYASLCLDPDRHGPQGEPYVKAEQVKTGTPLGLVLQKIVDIIADDPSLAEAFVSTDISSGSKVAKFRVAAQASMRIVGIATGTYVQAPDVQGFDGNEYKKYEEAAKLFNDPNSSVEAALDKVYSSRGQSFDYAASILQYVRDNMKGGAGKVTAIEREIDHGYPKVTDVSDNSFKIMYKGKIKSPSSIKIKGINKCGSNSLGITCYSAELGAAVAGDGYDTYEYTVEIGTNDALNMKVPSSNAEKLSVAFELVVEGASVGDAFVINPTGGGKNGMVKQRMVVFTVAQNSMYMYFSPIPPECLTELTALRAANCSDSDCSSFNKALFKAAKCCNLVADESVPNYNYLINNVCSAKCTTSTMEPVCNYGNMIVDDDEIVTEYDADGNPIQYHQNHGKYDLYQIHEGAYYGNNGWELNLSSAPDGGGACVVNVTQTKGRYYRDSGGHVTVIGKDQFITKDDLGNSRSVAEYANNKFCQVTCKEDFDLTMGAFGNYMGPQAIRAGSHFTMDDTKIYMYGAFQCFTTYVNYEDYGNIQAELSRAIVNQYDIYASWNHATTDLIERKKQQYHTGVDQIVGTNAYTYCEGYDWKGCLTGEKKKVCPKDEKGNRPTDCEDDDKEEVQFCYSAGWDCKEVTMQVADHTQYTVGKRYDDPQYPGEGQYQEFKVSGGDGISGMSVTDHAAEYADPSNAWACEVVGEAQGQDMVVVSDVSHEGNISSDGHTKPKVEHIKCDYADGITKEWPMDVMKYRGMEVHGPIDQQTSGDISDAAGRSVNALSAEFHENAQQFYYCQHFAVYTQRVGDVGAAAAQASDSGTGSDKTGGATVSPKTIGVDFNPTAFYSYDELQYMKTIGEDNLLVRDDPTNKKLSGCSDFGEASSGSCMNDTNPELQVKLANNADYTQTLYNNYPEERYCKVSIPWIADSHEAKTYGEGSANCSSTRPETKKTSRVLCMAGHMVAEGTTVDGKDGPFFVPSGHAHWVDGKCFTVTIEYKEANYIMKSVKNSSFYMNKGIWWNGPENVRVHGDYLTSELYGAKDEERQKMQGIYGYSYTSALDKYASIYGTRLSYKSGMYGTVGNYYNVFPVSMTTARGLYAYTYQFANVGTYFGQATLGRLMGNPESVVAVNSRTCFYEVYEEICGCCGDPIEYHSAVLEGSGSDTITETIREQHDDVYPTSTGVSDSYSSGSSDATLNFFTTVSSLSDLTAITDTGASRKLANNWGESFFSYGSNQTLVTHKGDDAKNAIQLNSDVIYSKTPEYSFELTPQVIQEIKTYNAQNASYAYQPSKLTTYGTYTIAPMNNCSSVGGCTWTEPIGSETLLTYNNSNFTHYGSQFLEKVVFDAASPETQTRLRNKTVCDSATTDINNYDATFKCRWVDYIETQPYTSSNGSVSKKIDSVCPSGQRYDINTDSCINASYYRLAFK